jgi:hypothetical protein
MKVRPFVWYAVGALAVALFGFFIGAHVLPQAGVQEAAEERSQPATVPVTEASAVAEAASLVEFGIETPAAATGQTPVVPGATEHPDSNDSAGQPAALTAESLLALDEPAPGHAVGEVLAVDKTAGTIDIRADLFSVLIKSADGSSERLSLPHGAKVTIVLPPNPGAGPHSALAKVGDTVRADIRVEPAQGDSRGRLVAVRVEVMGSQQ